MPRRKDARRGTALDHIGGGGLPDTAFVPEHLYRMLFEQCPTPMVVYDTSMRIIDCNHAMARGLGSSRERVIGLRIDDLRDQRHRVALERALEGETVTYEAAYNATTSDRSFWGSAIFAPIRGADGAVIAVMVLVTDGSAQLTERRKLEEQLRRAQRMEPLGLLAGAVAHDFNNVLTIIQVVTDFMLRDVPKDHRLNAEVLEIRQAAQRAAGLTHQLLAFSRKQVLRPRVLDLNELVTETTSMLRRLIGEDIELVMTLAQDLCLLVADPGQLQQVLMNLAINARDAMPSGGVLHLLTSGAIVGPNDALLPAGNYVVLTVADTGHGMDEGVQRRIFDPFFTTKPAGRGTGLGLSTVFGIVEQSGGKVAVTSEPGRGTRFTIYLPCGSAEAMPSDAPPAPDARAEAVHLATVLLVEDEEPVRRIAQRLLEAQGYSVLAAEDGYEALAIATAFSGTIDALVTDLVLPGLNGRQVAERLLQTRPDTAVLYVTGYTDDEILRRGLMNEEVRVLEKPFTAKQLDDAVREAISAQRSASDSQ